MKKEKVSKKSETDLVMDYANGIIKRQFTRGQAERIDKDAKITNKDLWLDTDFYFSVVFQSERQKHEFMDAIMKKLGLEFTEDDKIMILNGVKFAEKMGIKLKKESPIAEFPVGDLDLRPFVMDTDAK